MLRTMVVAVLGGIAGMFALLLFAPGTLVITLPTLTPAEQVTLAVGLVTAVVMYSITVS